MILKQQDYPNGQPQDLPKDDDVVDTGAMGGCSSVIFLWDPDLKGRFAHVRGYHGGGGLQAVNWPEMRVGVPNNKSTQVYVIASPENTTDHEKKLTKQFLRKEVFAYLPGVCCRTYQGIAQGTVNRKGELTIISPVRF